ncbi:hypothetical protein TIFTF001_001722 [Ficus carica]|uniref:Uncharacterized protein n=1 Tax=Ficus carica TaxID=3494 RepID=A0AA88D5H3_FICCA|nr:hypothetical protein TIFTF001_001722 [Ficus carica]
MGRGLGISDDKGGGLELGFEFYPRLGLGLGFEFGEQGVSLATMKKGVMGT